MIEFSGSDFVRIVGSAAVAASPDDFRAHLHSVFFELRAGKLSVAATSGTWIAMWAIPNFAPGVDDFSVIVPLPTIRRVLREVGAPKKKRASPAVVFDPKASTFEVGDITIRFKPVDAVYPAYLAIIPPVREVQTTAGFTIAAGLFAQLCKAFEIACGKRNSFFTVEPTAAALDAIACSSSYQPDFLVVAMPCRGERSEARRPKKEAAAAE